MKQNINEIKRMQQLAGLINEDYSSLRRQAYEQGYWNTEDTVEHLKDELKNHNIEFGGINTHNDFTALYFNLGEYDSSTIYIKDGKVTIEGKKFDLNESDTLGDIMDYILELQQLDEGHYWDTEINKDLNTGQKIQFGDGEKTAHNILDLNKNPELKQQVQVGDLVYNTLGKRWIVSKIEGDKISLRTLDSLEYGAMDLTV